MAKSALGCQHTGATRLPPPKVVAQRELWEVQPGAEGHQGRNWWPAFAIKREAASLISGSPGRQRQGVQVPQAASRTTALRLEALGGGCTASRKDSAAFPLLTGLLCSQHRGAGRTTSQDGRGAVPALGQPLFPRYLGPQARTPGRPKLPQRLPSGVPGTRGARRGRDGRRRQSRVAGANTRVSPVGCPLAPPTHSPGWGRRAPYLGEPRASGARRVGGRPTVPGPAHSPTSGCAQSLGAQSPSWARTPGLAHTRRPERAHPWASSRRRVRPGPGAHTLRVTPTAAAAGLARSSPPKPRLASPAANTTRDPAFATEKKKKKKDS